MKDHFYKQILDYSPIGLIHHKIIVDEHGNPEDFEFLMVNKVIENLMKKRQIRLLD